MNDIGSLRYYNFITDASGYYAVLVYRASSTWICPEYVNEVEYFVLGGGGGGGGSNANIGSGNAGGGGAGGLRIGTGLSVTPGNTYTITVGAGGGGSGGTGSNGSASFFGISPSGITADGGGG